jgi:uncharacterized protein YktA (UPF0223 family)
VRFFGGVEYINQIDGAQWTSKNCDGVNFVYSKTTQKHEQKAENHMFASTYAAFKSIQKPKPSRFLHIVSKLRRSFDWLSQNLFHIYEKTQKSKNQFQKVKIKHLKT